MSETYQIDGEAWQGLSETMESIIDNQLACIIELAKEIRAEKKPEYYFNEIYLGRLSGMAGDIYSLQKQYRLIDRELRNQGYKDE